MKGGLLLFHEIIKSTSFYYYTGTKMTLRISTCLDVKAQTVKTVKYVSVTSSMAWWGLKSGLILFQKHKKHCKITEKIASSYINCKTLTSTLLMIKNL